MFDAVSFIRGTGIGVSAPTRAAATFSGYRRNSESQRR
jgi:hypothetical protein